jgi:uncharacterized protein with PCYCGC motif
MRINLKMITASGVVFLTAAASMGLLSATSPANSLAKNGKQTTAGQFPKGDPAQRVPAFHAAPPREQLGPTLDPVQFKDPIVQNSYAMAAKVKNVLYQQPCYCSCDLNDGHHSLYDCFATLHASICNTCMAEGIFAYEQTHKGWSAAKIRAAIIRGDWRNVDLAAHKEPATVH